MFIQNFERLCKTVNEKPTMVLKEVGISPSRLTEWRDDEWKMPNQRNLYKLAEYFGCEVGEFFHDWYSSPEEYLEAKRKRDLEDYERAMEAYGLDENEEEFLRIYRALGPKERHRLMSAVYEFDEE